MKKKTLLRLLSLILIIISLPSCEKDLDNLESSETASKGDLERLETYRIEFGKTLAKALENKDVRSLLKKYALEKFDNDYDILYQVIKNERINSNFTLEEFLISISKDEDLIRKNLNRLPLLTIFIPKTRKFSAESWELDNQIPLVAVIGSSHQEDYENNIIAFDRNGSSLRLSSKTEPNLPVIVLKDNERVYVRAHSDLSPKLRHISEENFIASVDNFNYYFIDNLFKEPGKEHNNGTSTEAYISSANVDAKVAQAYDLGATIQRDYIYYNILNPNDRGPLDYNYAEYIHGLYFANKQAVDYASDWTDGDLEISVHTFFFNGTGALDNTQKVLPISKSDVINSDGTVKYYRLPTPVKIATWDMQRHGDTWSVVVKEIDSGATYTETRQSTSKFGANFSFDATLEKIVKIGLGFGGSAETQSTKTSQVQVTDTSDNLGDGILMFNDKVIIGKLTFLKMYNIQDVNTGSVALTILPKRVQ